MKTLFVTRPLPDKVIDAARTRFDVTVRTEPASMSEVDMVSALQNYDAVLPTLGDQFSPAVFSQAAPIRAKILANFGVGYNHIDVGAAKQSGLVVSNTPGAVTDATADIAMMLILMSARRASQGERMVRDGTWAGWKPIQLLGLHATGKTVGIVGLGRIGQAIAKRCHFGFGMDIKYTSRTPKVVDFPASYVADLSDLAGQVDFLVAAVPGGADTRHLINADILSAMQPHAHLINISRGEVVDETALIAALQVDQIGGAGLDVYEFEPKVPEALRALDNTSLLPHLGTAALEVREEMGMMALDNLFAWLDGKPLPNEV